MIKMIKRALRRRQLRKEIATIQGLFCLPLDRTAWDYWSKQYRAKYEEFVALGGVS